MDAPLVSRLRESAAARSGEDEYAAGLMDEAANVIERHKARIKQWPYAKAVLLPHLGHDREAPSAGEIFRQPELAATLRKLVTAAEKAAGALIGALDKSEVA